MCKVADTSRVSVSLRNMELVAAGEVAKFDITVDGTANSELAVSVKGMLSDTLVLFAHLERVVCPHACQLLHVLHSYVLTTGLRLCAEKVRQQTYR